jgi:aminoglycoside phosphotransferase (APT) family kinase protein
MHEANVDPAAVMAALGLGPMTAATPVQGGWDTLLWKVEHGGITYALRLFRAEQVETCHRETAAMRTAAVHGIPVPHIYREGSWEGRPVLLLSWCPGIVLLEPLRHAPWQAWPLGIAFGRMQARIHAVPAPDLLRARGDVWIERAGPDEHALKERLRALPLEQEALLHLDYHPLNVLVQGGRITCVLDWANAAAGDPRADLARTLTILRLAPAPPGTPRLHLALLRLLLELGWRRGYRQQRGSWPGDMALFYAWAGAAMARDLTPRLRQPRAWLTAHDLVRIHRWTAAWKRRAGIRAASPAPAGG